MLKSPPPTIRCLTICDINLVNRKPTNAAVARFLTSKISFQCNLSAAVCICASKGYTEPLYQNGEIDDKPNSSRVVNLFEYRRLKL